MSTFLWRFTGALMLRPAAYEEIESDRRATFQAMLVVVLSSLAAGVGVFDLAHGNPLRLAAVVVVAFALWAAWALMTFQIGVWVLPAPQTRATFGELLRTIGFATAPGIFRIAGLIPGRALAAFAVTSVWMLLAMIVAVRQALDYTSTLRAIAVCVLGWTLAIAMVMAIGMFFGPELSGFTLIK